MRIAMVVPPWIKVPPEKYGGIEEVVANLIRYLRERGVDITLYTVEKSEVECEKRYYYEDEMIEYLAKPPSSFLNVALTHISFAYMDIANGNYDLVHDHSWKEGLCCRNMIDIPFLHTIHSPMDEENINFYSQYARRKDIHFVALTDFQRRKLPELNYAGIVYNGIDVSKYRFSEEKEDFFLYLGRFNENKAPHIACEIAKKLNLRLILAGKVNEKEEKDYFEKYVRRYLNSKIVFLGEVSEREKIELFSKAKGYLFPIQWDEPFGITMVEALASGTPVITFSRGAAPEVVEHGKTGFVVQSIEEFEKYVFWVEKISPKACRERAEKLFSVEAMGKRYLEIYRKILEEWG